MEDLYRALKENIDIITSIAIVSKGKILLRSKSDDSGDVEEMLVQLNEILHCCSIMAELENIIAVPPASPPKLRSFSELKAQLDPEVVKAAEEEFEREYGKGDQNDA